MWVVFHPNGQKVVHWTQLCPLLRRVFLGYNQSLLVSMKQHHGLQSCIPTACRLHKMMQTMFPYVSSFCFWQTCLAHVSDCSSMRKVFNKIGQTLSVKDIILALDKELQMFQPRLIWWINFARIKEHLFFFGCVWCFCMFLNSWGGTPWRRSCNF